MMLMKPKTRGHSLSFRISVAKHMARSAIGGWPFSFWQESGHLILLQVQTAENKVRSTAFRSGNDTKTFQSSNPILEPSWDTSGEVELKAPLLTICGKTGSKLRTC